VLTGSALSDEIFGGDGNDFVNGGFGHDRVNGGDDSDRFFHIGVADHGSDWIQDYDAAEGDVLVFGNTSASADQFQINLTETENAGAAGVEEAFVIYRPTGQIMWALVDGAAQDEIILRIDGTDYDLMA
jgi:serralysin